MLVDSALHFLVRGAFIAAILALTGCANLAPVKSFADETRKVATAFDPLAAGTVEACVEKRFNRTLISTNKDFDAVKVKAAAEQLCRPLVEGNKYIAEIATLLEAYADTLGALADEKLPNYKDEFSNLKTAVNGVQINGKAIIPKERVTDIAALANFIAQVATQRSAAREAKALLDQQAGFDAAVDALSAYVGLVYKPYAVENLQQTEGSLMKELSDVEKSEPLAARVAKVSLAEDAARMKRAIVAADKFESAAIMLKAARAETRAGLDDKNAARRHLAALTEEVRSMRKQLVAAF